MFDRIVKYRKVVAAYKKLLLDEHGKLKPEAVTVLDDLYNFSRFFKAVPGEAQALAIVEGSRSVVRHILKRAGTTSSEIERKTKEQILGDDHV